MAARWIGVPQRRPLPARNPAALVPIIAGQDG
jgi:hypothetical protein